MTVETYNVVHDAGIVEYPGSTLLVGVDETGHELFADQQYPIFGIGGCAVLLQDYHDNLDEPWKSLKEQHFGGYASKLHASELGQVTSSQVNALGAFFSDHQFFRFAAMAGSSYINNSKAPLVQLLGATIWQQVAEIARWSQPTEVVVSIEDSERLRTELYGYIAGYEIGNERIRIKPRVFLANKDAKQSFMEVADFVMHAAGGQLRSRLLGKLQPMQPIRKDFASVFQNVDSKFTYHRELLEAKPVA